jgi:hypothetical protein
MEIFEWLVVTDIKQVATIAMGDERAVFDFPGLRIFLGFFPAVERFAVEKLDEAYVGISAEERLGGRENDSGGEGEEQISFHAAEK